MPIDQSLADVSNTFFLWTIVAYTVAMSCYAIEYAFGTRGAVAAAARSSAAPVRQRELVGVAPGGPATTPTPPEPPDELETAAPGLRSDANRVLGGIAVAATFLGFALALTSLVTRGVSVGRVPWGNMYEFVCLACLVGVLCWLIVIIRRPQLRHLGLFVLLPVVLLLGLAGTVLYAEAAPLVPALNSVWLKIHVSAAATSSGIFLFGFVCAVLYLLRQGYDARIAEGRVVKFPFTLAPRLPVAESLERLTFRVHALAFPLWTFAVIAGAIWAEAAWTRYWGWDPKETWAFISWVVYAAYLHARATAGWWGKRATFIVVLGWATMMVNLFVINLVQTGLHSYAGVN
ncbi:MAG: c-type cytochrome biogenesis protein CcsB [Acidimicrobiales bacterium]|nr:MAG: c-type cytochrome biogenesis protein CcsB [Acidimicrobiales bacterium]